MIAEQKTYAQAIAGEEHQERQKAIEAEYTALLDNKV